MRIFSQRRCAGTRWRENPNEALKCPPSFRPEKPRVAGCSSHALLCLFGFLPCYRPNRDLRRHVNVQGATGAGCRSTSVESVSIRRAVTNASVADGSTPSNSQPSSHESSAQRRAIARRRERTPALNGDAARRRDLQIVRLLPNQSQTSKTL
jgi:hypothetical protein